MSNDYMEASNSTYFLMIGPQVEIKTIMFDRPQTDQSPYMILRLLYLIMDLSWNHES